MITPSADDFFQDLGRRIRSAVVAVAITHTFEGSVALCFGREPVQALPVVAQELAQGVALGQRDADPEATLASGAIGFDEVVLVVVVQSDPGR